MKYASPPESIELARTTMRDLKEALTKDASGNFLAKYAEVDWDGLNIQPPDTAWQDMEVGERYDLLRHALDESIWSLEPSAAHGEPSDSQRLAAEFVEEETRQLNAEMRHDYGLRYLEDRGVHYEDAADLSYDRMLAEAAGRGSNQTQDRDRGR